LLGKRFINTLTDEKTDQFDNRRIDQQYLSEKVSDFSQYFYICGPDAMIDAIKKDLLALGAEQKKIIIEEF
jgi:ferredoxin-NADP reductase